MKCDRKEMLSVGERSDEIERLRRELEKIKQEIDNTYPDKQKMDHEEKRKAREHEERMARIRLEEMKSPERIKRERLEERKIVESEVQEKINRLKSRCEDLQKQQQSRQQREELILCGAAGVVTVAAGIGCYYGTAFAYGVAAGTALGAVMVVLLVWHSIG